MRAFILLSALLGACASHDEALVREEVRAEFLASEKAWNQGSLDGFMNSYLRSASLRFAGNDRYTLGFEKVLNNYRKGYPDREAMGVLTFSDVDINVISADAALVFGRWQVKKKDEASQGLFTLLFRKTKEGWRIVHDHTTSAD